MNQNLTDITLVVDRSGSMEAISDDAEGGINAFVTAQARRPGDAVLTLVQFDTKYDFVHRGLAISQVPKFTLVPRGATALLDAVGRAIDETGARLAAMPEADRPGLVAFVIVTDGLENSSKEFTRARVRQMIEHQQQKYQWHFTFLAANAEAFAEAEEIGISMAGAAMHSPKKMRAAYKATEEKFGRMREKARSGEQVDNAFTQEERRQMD